MGHLNAYRLQILMTLVVTAVALPKARRYNAGDEVPLFVNKVGPLNNPSETYEYYDLPFCSPDQVIHKKESIGEVLNGFDRLTNSLYELKFSVNKSNDVLCHKKLSRYEVAKFRSAVINEFYFQSYYDNLPFWGFIGKVEDASWTLDAKGPNKYFLFSHVRFDALYNGNQILEVHAFSDPNHAIDITEDIECDVEFSYSVFWKESQSEHKSRMDRYSKASILPLQMKVHWFSFINSVAIVFLLTGFVIMVLMQRLKNDLRKFSGGDEEGDKEVGWKYLHGDVFRSPSSMPLLAAIIGAGTQLLTMICFLFILSFLGILYPYNRGALSTTLVIIYTLTSAIAGFTSASFYSKFVETGWERSVTLAGMLFLVPFLLQGSLLNLVAMSFRATSALPLGTILVILLIYALIAIPLLALGGGVGYRCRSEFQAPSAQKRTPRDIPYLKWHQKTLGQMFLAGLLPFSAIAPELHYLYASMWGHKIFTLPGLLFVMFIILIFLTVILSVFLTHFQLAAEDHKWWWRSMFRGGSTAVFMFVYSIWFYYKSDMTGFLQTSFFFSYTACMCYGFFITLATIGFFSSFMFVRHIYRPVKSE
ncbi:unnamed protein product [Cuscuta europaea]|uniref:Transmembrane 9 superfamily member n=1 Tax=Cuscuta europaea TaxID=41803 RepID=A0A9P0YPW5_CUSEU|nr:unnamed protein product [Cuscuta europaea]